MMIYYCALKMNYPYQILIAVITHLTLLEVHVSCIAEIRKWLYPTHYAVDLLLLGFFANTVFGVNISFFPHLGGEV